MRDFAQPRVLSLAVVAALVSSLLCYPRLAAWPKREDAVWYLEVAIFGCTAVLWGFVFAWHSIYTERPAVTLRLSPKWVTTATAAGCVIATLTYLIIDPTMRQLVPEDYPANFQDWLGRLLFGLGLTQLFLLFAPFDWLMRLCKRPGIATTGTIIFGIAVLAMKIHSEKATLAPLMISALVLGRIISGYLAIQLYLRGGLLLTCWFTIVVETRHLLSFK